jgi:hypothetical protein
VSSNVLKARLAHLTVLATLALPVLMGIGKCVGLGFSDGAH